MRATAVTDIGKTRAVNQDYVYTSVDSIGCLPNLFIVADGMGGHKAGDTASRFTVETVKRLISESDQTDAISVILYLISGFLPITPSPEHGRSAITTSAFSFMDSSITSASFT